MRRVWLRPKNQLSKKHLHLWERYVWAWNKFGARTLLDCYKKPSGAKEHAWGALINSCKEMGAVNITITGYSCMKFSVGYIMPRTKVFVYETAERIYHIELEEVSGDGWKPSDGDGDVRDSYPKLMIVI